MLDGAVVQALPWDHKTVGEVWRHKRKLKVTAEVSLAMARAHAEMVGEPCSVVREGYRGPRGGRGVMHYINQPRMAYGQVVSWWPDVWSHRKGNRFYIVLGIVDPSHHEKVQIDAVASLQEYAEATP